MDICAPSIIYTDEYLVAAYKPAGLFVHRTQLDQADEFLLQIVRDLVGKKVYPLHRLDRPTSGLVLFALSSEIAGLMCNEFRYHNISKKYQAVVRGWLESGEVDYALLNERGNRRHEARTSYTVMEKAEYPFAMGQFSSVRYSLIEVYPHSGRMHQIRRHLKHVFHPVIGDTTYGDGKHNRLFREYFNSSALQLRAQALSFSHPITHTKLLIELPKMFELTLPDYSVDTSNY